MDLKILILILLYISTFVFSLKSVRLKSTLNEFFKNILFAFIVTSYLFDKGTTFSTDLFVFIFFIFVGLHWVMFILEYFLSPRPPKKS